MGNNYFGFRHLSSTRNIIGAHTLLEDPMAHGGLPILDMNPNAVVFACHMINPTGRQGILNPHYIGIAFVPGLGRWSVVNLDGAPMPPRVAFNILVYRFPRGAAFVHQVNASNFVKNTTWIDRPGVTNDLPRARLFVTSVLPPEGSVSGAGSLNHPIGVWYNERTRRWNIFNQDGAHMTPGVTFNVEEHFLSDSSGTDHSQVVIATGSDGPPKSIHTLRGRLQRNPGLDHSNHEFSLLRHH